MAPVILSQVASCDLWVRASSCSGNYPKNLGEQDNLSVHARHCVSSLYNINTISVWLSPARLRSCSVQLKASFHNVSLPFCITSPSFTLHQTTILPWLGVTVFTELQPISIFAAKRRQTLCTKQAGHTSSCACMHNDRTFVSVHCSQICRKEILTKR